MKSNESHGVARSGNEGVLGVDMLNETQELESFDKPGRAGEKKECPKLLERREGDQE